MPLSEEHATFQKELARIVEDHRADATRPGPDDVSAPFDEDLWKSLRTAGYLEAVTGPDGDGVLLGILAETVGRRLAPIPLVSSSALCGALLSAVAHEDRVTHDVLTGAVTAALCIDSGAVGSPRNRAVLSGTGDDTTVTASIDGVLGATHADHLLVVSGSGADAVLSVVSDSTLRRTQRPFDPSRDIGLVELSKTPARRIAGGASVIAALDRAVLVAALVDACEMVGAASFALQLTVEHLKTRHQFGRPLGTFQALQHACSVIALENEAALAAVRTACRSLAASDEQLELQVLAANSLATRALLGSARGAVQMHGGMGFTWELDAHHYLRRSQSSRARFFTPETAADLIATRVLSTSS